MYEKFTDRARRVMQLANQEAHRLNHEWIGTEHILLGLAREGGGVAALILFDLDVDLRVIQREVESLVTPGPTMVTMGKLPLTPRAKKVIEFAMEESRNLKHSCLDTAHVLLGLLREQEGVAAHVLDNLGVTLDGVRAMLAVVPSSESSPPASEEFRFKISPVSNEPKEPDYREQTRMALWCDVYTSGTEKSEAGTQNYVLKDKPSSRAEKAGRAVREFDAMFPSPKSDALVPVNSEQ